MSVTECFMLWLAGSPFVATVSADPGQVVVTGPSLAATPVGKTAHFSLNNVHSALDDVEVAVEGRYILLSSSPETQTQKLALQVR